LHKSGVQNSIVWPCSRELGKRRGIKNGGVNGKLGKKIPLAYYSTSNPQKESGGTETRPVQRGGIFTKVLGKKNLFKEGGKVRALAGRARVLENRDSRVLPILVMTDRGKKGLKDTGVANKSS